MCGKHDPRGNRYHCDTVFPELNGKTGTLSRDITAVISTIPAMSAVVSGHDRLLKCTYSSRIKGNIFYVYLHRIC